MLEFVLLLNELELERVVVDVGGEEVGDDIALINPVPGNSCEVT